MIWPRKTSSLRKGQKIAVELKSFIGPSALSEFHAALGRYLNYRRALRKLEPERTLFLAVPRDAYRAFFKLEFTQLAVSEDDIKLIVFIPVTEVIVEWIS